jgi:hypothetical protein
MLIYLYNNGLSWLDTLMYLYNDGFSLQDALTSNRYQLVLAMKCKDSAAAASALTCLGHVYTVHCKEI